MGKMLRKLRRGLGERGRGDPLAYWTERLEENPQLHEDVTANALAVGIPIEDTALVLSRDGSPEALAFTNAEQEAISADVHTWVSDGPWGPWTLGVVRRTVAEAKYARLLRAANIVPALDHMPVFIFKTDEELQVVGFWPPTWPKHSRADGLPSEAVHDDIEEEPPPVA
jgi:hypothetical protein